MDNIEGNYVKQFDAKVIKTKDDYIVLDKTAFYPEGGGQPSDTGIIKWANNTSLVTHVTKKGIIRHQVEREIPQTGTQIQASLNWPIRYAHMKMHTAQHIISGIVFDTFNARTVGNQIHADYSRVDFKPASFTDNHLKKIESQCNEIINKNLPIKIYSEQRDTLEKRVNQQRCNLDLLPRAITTLRIVEIQEFDICPCAGTHVRNTSEIPQISIMKRESKGKDTSRIIYKFLSL